MKNNQVNEHNQQEEKTLPGVALLLGAPIAVASSMLAVGQVSDFATLNQLIMDDAYANSVTFQNDGPWTELDGSYRITDHSNHSNHSNHQNWQQSDDGGGGDGSEDDDDDDDC